jgi:hypothetical protein
VTYRLWGFVGQLRGNELAARRALPIVLDERDRLWVAQTPAWTGEHGLRCVGDEDDASRFGTALVPTPRLEVAPGQVVIVVGPAYQAAADALGLRAFSHLLSSAADFRYRVATPGEAEAVSRAVDALVLDRFWTSLEQAATDALGPSDQVTHALNLLSVSDTLERSEYYIAALASQKLFSSPRAAPSDDLLALAAAELGLPPEPLMTTALLRVAYWSRQPQSSFGPARRRPIQMLTLTHLTRPPTPILMEEIAVGLEEARTAGREYKVDLRPTNQSVTPSALRLDTGTMLLVTNLLIAAYRDVPLDVALPETRHLGVQLARGGLLFALARATAANDSKEVLSSWLQVWHQSSLTYRQALFSETDVLAAPRQFSSTQRYLMTLINPHARGGSEEQAAQIASYLGTWIWRRATNLAGDAEGDLEPIATTAAEVMRQLFLNIREFAGLDRSPSADRRDSSLLQVFFTRGGTSSSNRLYLLVLDTGMGIPARVRELQQDADIPAVKALLGVLDGTFRQWRPNRGWGLSDIHEACIKHSERRPVGSPAARMLLASGDAGAADISAVAALMPDRSAPPSADAWRVPIQGTCVLVELPLRFRSALRTGAEQLELEFNEPELSD